MLSTQSLQGQRLRRSRDRDTRTEMQRWLPREERAEGLRVTGAQQCLRQLGLLSHQVEEKDRGLRRGEGRSGNLSQRLGLVYPCLALVVSSGPGLVR